MHPVKLNESGTVTDVPGFLASGVAAGFKKSGAPDFALLYSEAPANFAGVFTSCTFAAAPVLLGRERVRSGGTLRAVAVNSGIANACTGATGLDNARRSCEIVASRLGVAADQVLVSSTGRIGVQLPMGLIEKGVAMAADALSASGGADAARAIMTTDTVPKSVSTSIEIGGKVVTIGAMTKGAGMIDPHLAAPHATMLCFVATDAAVDNDVLAEILIANAEGSFNRITVDGDMSTNDTVLVLANGRSGVTLRRGDPGLELFADALLQVMRNLARRMAADGEGATKLITVEIHHARSTQDAKLAAEAIANSLLCKTAWFGNDPNWGRVVAALGYSGAVFDPEKCDIFYDDMPVVTSGGDSGVPESQLVGIVSKPEFTVSVDFHAGDGEYWVWTCDISYEYVKINADYHT